MAAASNGISLEQLYSDLKNRAYKPVYFLSGEEPYYIDRITDYIIQNVLTADEKAFNQTILYGKDTDAGTVINMARRYPMMSDYQLVVLKEAQEMKSLEELGIYISNPLKTTILVINHKYKNPDKRKSLFKILQQHAVYYQSDKLYENNIPAWITNNLERRKIRIEEKAAILLTEFLGTDLSKISNELDKLAIVTAGSNKPVTAADIERNIGISKDYNNFELQKALGSKNALKANRIINYFADNQKTNNIVVTMGMLFSYFSKLMLIHTLKDKSSANLASRLKLNSYHVKEYESAARNYPYAKLTEIMTLLREYDMKSKGFGNVSADAGDLLKELIFKILH